MKTEYPPLPANAGNTQGPTCAMPPAPLEITPETPGETPGETLAETLPQNTLAAIPASALAKIGTLYAPALTAAEATEILNHAAVHDADGESILFTQSQILDTLFHRLVDQSLGAKNILGQYRPDYVDETRLSLALRAQKQCRANLYSLNAVREFRNSRRKK